MAQPKLRTPMPPAPAPEKLELTGVEDESGAPISSLTILSLLERVAGIIDSVQAGQQRMEERQLELENSIKSIQGDVLKLAKDHGDTSGTVEKLMQKARKVSANVKDVRTRVEKQHVRVKKVESTQDELLTRNRFRVVIYQGDTEIPSLAVTKTPKGEGLAGVAVEPDTYGAPGDLSSDEEYMVVEEAESRAARLKKSGKKGIENIKAAFSRESMTKTKENLGTKFNHLGERIVPPERREKMHQASVRLKENIAKKAPTKESFKIKLKKERTVAEGEEGAEGATDAGEPTAAPKGQKSTGDVTYTEVVTESKREGPVSEQGATRIGEEGKIQFSVTAVDEDEAQVGVGYNVK